MLLLSNLYFGFNATFINCTFVSNHAQFGGILDCLSVVASPAIFNFTDCIGISNEASKANTFYGAGIDYSQGGAIAVLGFGGNTYFYLQNFFIGMSYSPKG